jgi:hypothetical protein
MQRADAVDRAKVERTYEWRARKKRKARRLQPLALTPVYDSTFDQLHPDAVALLPSAKAANTQLPLHCSPPDQPPAHWCSLEVVIERDTIVPKARETAHEPTTMQFYTERVGNVTNRWMQHHVWLYAGAGVCSQIKDRHVDHLII